MVELLAAADSEADSVSQQVFDSYRPEEEESFSAEDVERRLRGLITELPIGVEYALGVMEGPDRGMMMPLHQPVIVIGKTGCDLNLRDTSVSREHCRIEIYGREMIVVRDLDSNWGTFKNGAHVSVATMKPGDQLQIGKTMLVLIQTRTTNH
ncbi:FHA domain-containing protein [bacterium]|nr:FHA domain-containing protein [candidate division CSSED10-310 bacterium]